MSTANLTSKGDGAATGVPEPPLVQDGANDPAGDLLVRKNMRILIVDDNQAIHTDFRKILCAQSGAELEGMESALGGATAARPRLSYEIDSGYQGQEGVALVEKAQEEGCPYALAFVDVRMPPGWDGVETTSRIWKVCPDTQIVLCTAYSDYSWDEVISKLNYPDRLVILKKPFDAVEVLQLAAALTEKYRLALEARGRMNLLEAKVEQRTQVLQKTNERNAINCCSGKTRSPCLCSMSKHWPFWPSTPPPSGVTAIRRRKCWP
jgi:CheY-like chemotaxis protein